jgi:hypothetical protein
MSTADSAGTTKVVPFPAEAIAPVHTTKVLPIAAEATDSVQTTKAVPLPAEATPPSDSNLRLKLQLQSFSTRQKVDKCGWGCNVYCVGWGA